MTKGRTAPPKAAPELLPLPKLEFSIPGPNEPGFLRRQREAIYHREQLRTDGSVASIDGMIGFLTQFVTSPADREQARELLLDLSREDYNNLLNAVNREDPDFLP